MSPEAPQAAKPQAPHEVGLAPVILPLALRPEGPRPLMLPAQDVAHCRGWITRHSRSFYLSSLLLPRSVRQASWALYAFCRRADDAVDAATGEAGSDEARLLLARVAGLRAGLDRVYGAGRGAVALPPYDEEAGAGGASNGSASLVVLDDPVDRAFRRVAARHAIPRGVPEALLAGMEMDARSVAYPTWEALYTYCFRVASTVGLMMTRALGASRGDAPLRAAELGIAMQLTNIARDVGEDARRGRVYLPDELLARCGTDRAAVLAAREATPAIREATRLLLVRAEDFYRSAERGIPLLPLSCRPAIASARFIYGAIGREIERAGFDSVTRRAHTSTAWKLAMVVRALPVAFAPARPSAPGPADALISEQIRAAGLAVEV